MPSSVELFSGCGGLALGLSKLGFNHLAMIEFNECAVATVQHNKKRQIKHVQHWPLEMRDVREVDWTKYAGTTLVAGGPPCQPFSIGGKANGANDDRDMWPEAIRAVREIRPLAFVFENVRGLMRPRFANYLESIRQRLANATEEMGYSVGIKLVNAADFGAAQKRQRVVIVGVQGEHEIDPDELEPSHSRERLVWDQWISGEYWDEHGINKCLNEVPRSDAAMVRRLQKLPNPPQTKRWVTVRDRLIDLGEPNGINNHKFQAGAKVYPGHTGSPLDLPAKALKAGDHGVPGGENMMVRDDGTVRYFTLRECARLQGFPDDFEFPGSWSESMRQLGNAVPVELSVAVGSWVTDLISKIDAKFAMAA